MERRDSAPNLPIFSRIYGTNHENDDGSDEEEQVAALIRRSSLPLEVLASGLSLNRTMESPAGSSTSTIKASGGGAPGASIGTSDRAMGDMELGDDLGSVNMTMIHLPSSQQHKGHRPTSIALPPNTNHLSQYTAYPDHAGYRNTSSGDFITNGSSLPPIIGSPFIPPPPTPPLVPSSYEGFYYHTPALPFHTPSPSIFPDSTRQYPCSSRRPHSQPYHGNHGGTHHRHQLYYSAASLLREGSPGGSPSPYNGPHRSYLPTVLSPMGGYTAPPRLQSVPRSTSTTALNALHHTTPPKRSNSHNNKSPYREQQTPHHQTYQATRQQQALTSADYQYRQLQQQYTQIIRPSPKRSGDECEADEERELSSDAATLVATTFEDLTCVVWVGNLPVGAGERVLREHFSGIDIKELEIHVEACICCLALSTFNDVEKALQYDCSILNGNELKVRQLNNKTSSGRPSLPSPSAGSLQSDTSASSTSTAITTPPRLSNLATRLFATPPRSPAHELGDPLGRSEREGDFKFEDRYFIMKSLSIEDLEIARERGYWATQAKNETILNRAYHNTRNVYLVFSANKSGEFYGCARMESGIEGVIDPMLPPTASSTATGELPLDSRGVIGENINSDDCPDDDVSEAAGNPVNIVWAPIKPPPFNHDPSRADEYVPPKWGSPFKIRWLVIYPLPFSQTKHLRNSWNANKQVKVSRDGTEVETTAGRRIIQEFQVALSKSTMVRSNSSGSVTSSLDVAGARSSQAGTFTQEEETESLPRQLRLDDDALSDHEEDALAMTGATYQLVPHYQHSTISPAMIGSPLAGGPGSPSFFDTTHLRQRTGVHTYPSPPAISSMIMPRYYSPTI
ncbi:hypothetical protein SeMB42_g04102 [Synchytrium endobioticum]|uniref:YTH domain-containing protein n=1 Tax=Synchytrium endobioticum TaxID=286115 RepID=A0A507CL59_9FUNG|nr:hypothetical protein SeLEV6574_g07656 [Synchytrium endobioticum]TPX45120.1 hypothetical protein SeMB42_g04102 [Synchytrium endobioticum]